MSTEKCFACDRPLGKDPKTVYTSDGQSVFVGQTCYKLIVLTGFDGYQPPKGGPRLFSVR